MLNRMSQVSRQKGVGMIEILITVVVISFGFLSLLALQLNTLKNATTANQYFTVAMLAHDMGDRIRANVTNAGDYNGIDTSDTYSCNAPATIILADSCAWQTALIDQSGLPDVVGTVAVGAVATISIEWTENVDGIQTQTFELEVPVQ